MSATQDKKQKAKFVYPNVYQLFDKKTGTQKEKINLKGYQTPGYQSTKVLKPEYLKEAGALGTIRLNPHMPTELNKKVSNPSFHLTSNPTPNPTPSPMPSPMPNPNSSPKPNPESDSPQQSALKSLKGNLKTLEDLHNRLQFMLKELEQFIDE